MVDALGNPLAFLLSPGQAQHLEGADAFLPQMSAGTLLADKAFDADERVIEPLLVAGKIPAIPPKSSRKIQRAFRDCIRRGISSRTSSASSSSIAQLQPAMTRRSGISSPASSWQPPSSCSIEDRP